MKIIFCVSFIYTLCIQIVIAQPLRVGICAGAGLCFSSYYDVNIDPQKTLSTVEPNAGLVLDYIPFKAKNFFLSTGAAFVQFANTFEIEGVPYFSYKEGFPKIKQRYNGLKIPIRLGYKWNTKNRIEFNASLGLGFLLIRRSSFYEYQQVTVDKVIDGREYAFEYEIAFRSINKTNLFIEPNFELEYKVNHKMNICLSLTNQQGITPILGSTLKYSIINKTNPFTLVGNSYVTSKGDAIFVTASLKYKIGKDLSEAETRNSRKK